MTRNRPIPTLSQHKRDYVYGLVAFEDEAILAINKPSGLPSQVRGNRARNLDHLLWAFARSNGKRPRLVHRLDAGTSGIILAGKTQPDAAALSNSLSSREATKTYLALVSGALPEQKSGAFHEPIARIDSGGRTNIVAGHPDGKPAHTHWTLLGRAGDVGLIELRPTTGRMHQLRVHLSHHGCPILGDTIYGGAPASRLALHAARITLPHPRTGDPITLSAPLPDDFLSLATHQGLETAVSEWVASG